MMNVWDLFKTFLKNYEKNNLHMSIICDKIYLSYSIESGEPGQDRKVAALSLALDVGKAFLFII